MNLKHAVDWDRRGGRRKSQLFLDLCAKFEENNEKQEPEIADEPVRFVDRSRDPPNFGGLSNNYFVQEASKFKKLRANWESYVLRKILWKQQTFKITNNRFSVRPIRRGGVSVEI